MTFPQIRLILTDPEKLEQEWRYRQMTPNARSVADDIKRRFGSF